MQSNHYYCSSTEQELANIQRGPVQVHLSAMRYNRNMPLAVVSWSSLERRNVHRIKAKPVSVQSVQKAAAERDSSAQDDGSSIVHADSPQNLSLVSGMTRDAIEKHLESLNIQIRLSSRTVTQKCLPVIQELIYACF
jgi:hypothetical protein